MSSEKQLLEKYITLKKECKKLSDELASLEKSKKNVEQMIVNILLQKGAKQTAKYEDVGFANLQPIKIKTASYPKQQESDFFSFVRKTGHPDIIKESIHPITLKSFFTTCLVEGIDIPPYAYYETSQGITIYDRTNK